MATDQHRYQTVTIITTDGDSVTTMTAQNVSITADHDGNLRGTYTLDIDRPTMVSTYADTVEAALVRTIGALSTELGDARREVTAARNEAARTHRLLTTAQSEAWDEGYRAARPATPFNPYGGNPEDDPDDTF